MNAWLLTFFRELESAIPPTQNCHHGMMRTLYGSDETGWEERLTVSVLHGGLFRNFFLEESDTDPKVAALQIADLVNNAH